jgi:hypothetical protein
MLFGRIKTTALTQVISTELKESLGVIVNSIVAIIAMLVISIVKPYILFSYLPFFILPNRC